MRTIKEQIRAKIERLKERAAAERVLHPQTILAAKNYLLLNDYDNLLAFLDTLPEDPTHSAAEDLVSAVERYVQPKPGDKYCSRSELLNTKDNLKALLK